MMMLNTAVGILVFLVGMVLMASIALNLHTQHMLKQCREILDFCIDMAERETSESVGREGTE